MIAILRRFAIIEIASAALGFAIAAHSEDYQRSPDWHVVPQLAEETLYQSWPEHYTAMLRGGQVIALMPQDTEIHHVDTSEGYPHLYPGSCIAAPPARCLLHPGQVEPMQSAPTR